MLVYLQDRSFAPVAPFPINWLADWSAIELDYLGVNRSYDRAQEQSARLDESHGQEKAPMSTLTPGWGRSRPTS